MRTATIEKEKLVKRLERKFGKGEPIFTKEIMETWKEYSRARVFQLIKGLGNVMLCSACFVYKEKSSIL